MSKKVLFIVLLLVLTIAGAGYYFWNKGKKVSLPDTVQTEISPTPILSLWDDPAQFTFQYPEGIIIDAHPENKVDYAQVELKATNHPGGVVVWSKDTTATTVDDFIKQEKIDTALDTTLGGIPAKKYYSGADKSLLSVATIQYGNLYLIETDLEDGSYWTKISDMLLSSFQFKELPTSVPDQSGYSVESSEDYGNGDEVIE